MVRATFLCAMSSRPAVVTKYGLHTQTNTAIFKTQAHISISLYENLTDQYATSILEEAWAGLMSNTT